MREDRDIIARLRRDLGADAVLDQAADLFLYATDASRRRGSCLCAVRPTSESQIVKLVNAARDLGFCIVPRGAGTSTTGSALPQNGAVVLDLSAMNRILEINPADQLAICEPGVLTGTLQAAVADQGLLYPPDPASSRFSTLGGNVATGAGGLRAVKYGVTRDYVLGVRGVLANGTVLETGSRALKDVAGYDLTRLLVGSEGTLLIFTRLILKLVPAPAATLTLLASFPEEGGALDAADRVLGIGVVPRAMEYLDRDVLGIVASFLGQDPEPDVGSRLLLELDGGEAQVAEDAARTKEALAEVGVLGVETAGPGPRRDALWEARRSISAAVYRATPAKVSEDIGVPRGELKEAIRTVKEIGARHGIRVLAYGHAGDANLHCNFLYDPAEAGIEERLQETIHETFEEAVRRGGTISGEHGIGLSKREFLASTASDQVLELYLGIKRLFDPEGMLNPGKILVDPKSGDGDSIQCAS